MPDERSRIGFLVHPGEKASVEKGIAAARALGFECWTVEHGAVEGVAAHAAETALLVTVGGDGTFLLGARLAAPHAIPVLGVNRGRLGFLTDVEVADLPRALEAFKEDQVVLQRRSMLELSGASFQALALNDVVVKSTDVTAIRIRVEGDGELFGDFDADGIVVSTATGSTAYALSAGGPLIDPRLKATVVVPLAAHAVVTRALVVPDTTSFSLTVSHGEAGVAADGIACGRLRAGESVAVTTGPYTNIVRLPDSPAFIRRVREKLHFGRPLKVITREDRHES
jgi:NAD+ kinase